MVFGNWHRKKISLWLEFVPLNVGVVVCFVCLCSSPLRGNYLHVWFGVATRKHEEGEGEMKEWTKKALFECIDVPKKKHYETCALERQDE